MRRSKKADYVVTGLFAKKAAQEAEKFGSVNVAASSEDRGFTRIPDLSAAAFSPDADYVHITSNNTIYGTRFTSFPETGAPLAADMSSNILSEPVDVSRFGLIYAGAQKNIGPSGLCVAVIRKDLVGFAPEDAPVMLDYRTYADNASLYNTPPAFAIYVAKLVFEWLEEKGGVAAMEKLNCEKAAALYTFLDESSLFRGVAEREFRSMMNVTFTLPSEELTAEFLSEASAAGFVNLKGHRAVGGVRASLYNAMPVEGATALADFMKRFEAARAKKYR
jgi:phosphoserine aminotransferase